MSVPYYADDFKFYFPALEMNWTDHFIETGPTTGFYRPLQNAILTLIQQVAGSNPVPVHALTLAFHVGDVALVYKGSRWIGASDTQAVFAAGLMAVAQAGAAAVIGKDTLSQVGATLFGYLSLWGYGRVLASDGHRVAAYTGVSGWLFCSKSLPSRLSCFWLVLRLPMDGEEPPQEERVIRRFGSARRASLRFSVWRLCIWPSEAVPVR
jgi:hypothetical protein